jgi:outer membrane protein TolC
MLLVLALAAAPAAQAQDTLTLPQAISESLANNASLAAARAGADAEGSGIAAARAALWPRITFTESWQRGDQPVFVFGSLLASRRFTTDNFAIAALNQPDPLSYFHATTAVEQQLFDGGRRGASVALARARHDLADSGAREAALTIAREVTATFGQLVTAQASRRSAAAALDAAREDLARAAHRRDAGVATEADVLALAVHAADMEQRVIQADGDAAVLRAALNRLMGAPVPREFIAEEPAALVDDPLPPLQSLVADAERDRPDLARARASERMAEAGVRSARAAVMPTVAAQAAFDVSGLRFQERASNWIVGGEVRWSLTTAGAERAQVKAAGAARTRARAEREDARARVEVELVSALHRIRAARARQVVGRAAVEQARESQRIIRDRYEAGLAPVNDVLRAAAAVLDAEAQRVAALVDALTSRAELDRAAGRQP